VLRLSEEWFWNYHLLRNGRNDIGAPLKQCLNGRSAKLTRRKKVFPMNDEFLQRNFEIAVQQDQCYTVFGF